MSDNRRPTFIDPTYIPQSASAGSPSTLSRARRFQTIEHRLPRTDSVILPRSPGETTEDEDEALQVPRIPPPQHGPMGVGYYNQATETSPRPLVNPLESIDTPTQERATSHTSEISDFSFSTDGQDAVTESEPMGFRARPHHEESLFHQGVTIPLPPGADGANSTDEYLERTVSMGESYQEDSHRPTRVYQFGEAPMFSLTAQAATGKTEQVTETVSAGQPQTSESRHYEGCMLCSPLPSPGSSLSSLLNDREFVTSQDPSSLDSTAPPDIRGASSSQDFAPQNEFNPLSPFLQGEVILRPTDIVVDGSGRNTSGVTLQVVRPAVSVPSFSRPSPYAQPGHGESLSTLIEGDEENYRASSSRPQTAGTSRLGTSHGNNSDISLIRFEIEDRGNETQTRPPPRNRNPFRMLPTRLSAIQEAPNRISWFNIFSSAREQPAPPVIAPEAPPELINPSPDRRASVTSILGGKLANLKKPGDVPHPGLRRDTPAVDGSYEMVDLDPAPEQLIGLSRESVQMLRNGPRRKPLISGYVIKWSLIALGVVVIILVIILPIVFLGFPAMAQRAVDSANLNVTSLTLTGARTDAVGLRIDVSLTNSKTNAWVQPGNLKLSIVEQEATSALVHKRSNITLQRLSRTLGYLKIPETYQVGKGATEPVKLTGEKDGTFAISDPEAWGSIVEGLLFKKDGVDAQLDGVVEIRSGALRANCNVKKSIVLPGMGGFDISVIEYQILEGGQEKFTASLDLISNSSITLSFNNVDFDLIFGTTTIGYATIHNFAVHPGHNELNVYGTLDKVILANNSIMYGEFISALYRSNTTYGRLALQGTRSTLRGREIGWLSRAIKQLQIPLPGITTGPEKATVESFDMELSLSEVNNGHASSIGSISSTLKLPFQSSDKSSIITKVGYDLDLSMNKVKFASLKTPLLPSRSLGKENLVSVEFTEASLAVFDLKTYGDEFLKSVLQKGNFSINIGGNVTTELATRIGNATVRDIPFPEDSWKIEGYQGIGAFNPVILQNVDLFLHKDGLLILSKMSFYGNGSIDIDFGTIHMDAFYGSDREIIGKFTVPSFGLTNGLNVHDATITVSPKISSYQLFNQFFSTYIMGGEIPLYLEAAEDQASAIPHVYSAFNGLKFPAILGTPSHMGFIYKIEFVRQKDEHGDDHLEMEFIFMNIFKIPMSITGLELTISLPESNEVLGTLHKFTSNKHEAQADQTLIVTADLQLSKVGLQEFDTLFQTGPPTIRIKGTTTIGWSEFAIPLELDFKHTVAMRN